MENYIVSARKYRPVTFHSVIGQKSLTTTLKNAIRSNKLAHAYLFCGPRGVGKTTCARIFAKTINCLHPKIDGESCNECESCRAFNENRSYNIYELDAASNNSVDDIRALTDQVRIPPQIGKYKVYIIDEVHMLSSQAFNAFLKTLEEPPVYTLFILATTEKHKIIPTILSRCQIYDFNRIQIDDMVEYLEYVAKNEHITYEKEALNVIAQKADGGMRDALSIFDQVAGFSGDNITYRSAIENLNVLDYEYYFRLLQAMLQKDVSQCLLILNEIAGKGFDGQHIVSGMSNFFRDILVCKDPQTLVLFEKGDAIKEKYLQFAQQCMNEFLYKALEWSNECDLNYRYSKNKQLLIELLLIRLCQWNHQSIEVDDKKKIAPLVPKEERVPDTAKPVRAASPQVKSVAEIPASAQSPQQIISKYQLGISIKTTSGKVDETKAEKEEQKVPVRDKSFTQEDLEMAWRIYAAGEDDVHLKNTMLNISPLLQENTRIQIAVFNPEQQNKLMGKKAAIKDFLFQQLENSLIELEITITENAKTFTPYGSKSIFEYMAGKNSSLITLAKEFNLKLD
jgi:DNA polymerase-3 subunit gamma/tau